MLFDLFLGKVIAERAHKNQLPDELRFFTIHRWKVWQILHPAGTGGFFLMMRNFLIHDCALHAFKKYYEEQPKKNDPFNNIEEFLTSKCRRFVCGHTGTKLLTLAF